MRDIRSCANPSCRKDFLIQNEDDEYCPACIEKIKKEKESKEWEHLSLRSDVKRKLDRIKFNIRDKTRESVPFTDIVRHLINLAEKNGDISAQIIKIIEEKSE